VDAKGTVKLCVLERYTFMYRSDLLSGTTWEACGHLTSCPGWPHQGADRKLKDPTDVL